jgi:alkylation response protein AidB-like acyl-CoA dehydrogenase
MMSAAFTKAAAYAAERYQGGKMIIDHTHVRAMLGGMSAGVASSAGSVYHAASRPDDTILAIATKKTVTDCAARTCTEAVQVLGGYGYMRDYGIEKMMRDAAVLALLPVSNPRCELLLAAMEKDRIS